MPTAFDILIALPSSGFLGRLYPATRLGPTDTLQRYHSIGLFPLTAGCFNNPRILNQLEKALAAYAREAAYGEFTEKTKDTLEPGKLADLIVLSQDLFRVPPLAIHNTAVVMTLVGERIVCREGF
jgi:hypothetical protein